MTKIGTDILATASTAATLYQSSAGAEIGQPVTLPGPISDGVATTFGNNWLLAGTEPTLYRFQPGSKTVSTESGSWPTIISLATFGTNLYALEATSGQIWKYPQKTTGFGERTGYLKSPDPTGLSHAIALAIDGDVFVALADGFVKKYTRGIQDETWQLHNLPSPWDKIQKPKSIFTTSESSHFYLFEEQVSNDQPARLLEFDKNGAYLRQLFLPVDWPIEALWFDSLSQTGLVVNDQKAYPITFPNS